jgi:hypothetical protein
MKTFVKNYKVTVKGESGSISYDVIKTMKGANSFANKIANEAFYGEQVAIEIVELPGK